MSTTGANEFREVSPENMWHVLRACYGPQLQAASVSVLLMREDGVAKFEVITMPQAEGEKVRKLWEPSE